MNFKPKINFFKKTLRKVVDKKNLSSKMKIVVRKDQLITSQAPK